MKRLGLCTVCDVTTHEVTRVWTEGPDAGFPRNVGTALPGTKRANLVLLSGRRTDWTLCQKCHITPANLPVCWRKAQAAYARECWQEHKQQGLLLYLHETPLGVLYEEAM